MHTTESDGKWERESEKQTIFDVVVRLSHRRLALHVFSSNFAPCGKWLSSYRCVQVYLYVSVLLSRCLFISCWVAFGMVFIQNIKILFPLFFSTLALVLRMKAERFSVFFGRHSEFFLELTSDQPPFPSVRLIFTTFVRANMPSHDSAEFLCILSLDILQHTEMQLCIPILYIPF